MPHGQFAPRPRSGLGTAFLGEVPPVMLVNISQELPQQEAEGSGSRPTKKSRNAPLCTCGTFNATRRARSLESGHGGIAMLAQGELRMGHREEGQELKQRKQEGRWCIASGR